jgi:hypothetical protein
MDIPPIEQVKIQARVLVPLVTECRYAQFYKEMGAPALGFLLTCSADFPMTEGFGTDVQLTRTQTIMQGASHCDFRYVLKQRENDTR